MSVDQQCSLNCLKWFLCAPVVETRNLTVDPGAPFMFFLRRRKPIDSAGCKLHNLSVFSTDMEFHATTR